MLLILSFDVWIVCPDHVLLGRNGCIVCERRSCRPLCWTAQAFCISGIGMCRADDSFWTICPAFTVNVSAARVAWPIDSAVPYMHSGTALRALVCVFYCILFAQSGRLSSRIGARNVVLHLVFWSLTCSVCRCGRLGCLDCTIVLHCWHSLVNQAAPQTRLDLLRRVAQRPREFSLSLSAQTAPHCLQEF